MALFLIVVIIVGIVLVGQYQSKTTDENWSRAASMLGLTSQSGGFFSHRQMSGRRSGCRVVVDTFTRSRGKNSQTYTRFRVDFPHSLGLGLRLTEQGFLSSITKVFGAQDIDVGNASFDRGVIIKGADERLVRSFFTSHMQKRVSRLFAGRSELSVTDSNISWNKRGVVRDVGMMVTTVRQFVDAAVDMANARVSEEKIPIELGDNVVEQLTKRPSMMPRRKKGTLAKEPPSIPMEATESPLLAAFRGKAADTKAEWPKVEPEPDPEPAPEPEPIPDSEPEPAPEPEPILDPEPEVDSQPAPEEEVAPVVDALNLDGISERIFDSSQSTFSRMKMFQDEFKGKTVLGTGTIKKVEKFTYDFALGNKPGCKVTVAISKAEAVVALPESEYDSLHASQGETLAFQGTFVKLDTFPARLYVTDAFKK